MGMITLKEYCERYGKNFRSSRRKAAEGRFATARKMGRDWFIDENEEFVDQRITDGKWIGYKRKRPGKESE